MPLILLTLLSNHHPKQKLYAHQALAPHLPSVRSLGNLFSFLFQSLCLFQTSLTMEPALSRPVHVAAQIRTPFPFTLNNNTMHIVGIQLCMVFFFQIFLL